MAKYTPQKIANYFIEQANKENVILTKLKLMKLVYISYAWYLYYTDEDLFDEVIEAWQYGEVIPSLEKKYKNYKKESITQIDGKVPNINQDRDLADTVGGVWYLYKNQDVEDIINILHEKDSPWFQVYKPDVKHIKVNTEEMKPIIKQRAEIGIIKANEKLAEELKQVKKKLAQDYG
jgi:uncharacterized phage-associated protein